MKLKEEVITKNFCSWYECIWMMKTLFLQFKTQELFTLAKILHGLKMVFLQKDIKTKLPPRAIFVKDQLQKIYQFVDFVVYISLPWWFTAEIPYDAAANYLYLYRKTLEHPKPVASTSVIPSFLRHARSLTEKMIALSFFSDNT